MMMMKHFENFWKHSIIIETDRIIPQLTFTLGVFPTGQGERFPESTKQTLPWPIIIPLFTRLFFFLLSSRSNLNRKAGTSLENRITTIHPITIFYVNLHDVIIWGHLHALPLLLTDHAVMTPAALGLTCNMEVIWFLPSGVIHMHLSHIIQSSDLIIQIIIQFIHLFIPWFIHLVLKFGLVWLVWSLVWRHAVWFFFLHVCFYYYY